MNRLRAYNAAFSLLIVAALLTIATGSATVSVAKDTASNVCSSQGHLYGKLLEVNGNLALLESSGSAGRVYLQLAHATVRPSLAQLHSGIYARARGCFGKETLRGKALFRATYLTLAATLKDLAFISDRPQRAAVPTKVNTSVPTPHAHLVAPPRTSQTTSQNNQSCSGWRWSTKIGTDSAASSVKPSSAQSVTIAQLTILKSPETGTLASEVRSRPSETTVYRLTNVTLSKIYTEHDGDYHLVVSDASGNSMTLESPDPNCAFGSAFFNQIRTVRSYLEAHQPAPGTTLTVTGVGFFDPPGSGGLELHPLVSICSGANCTP